MPDPSGLKVEVAGVRVVEEAYTLTLYGRTVVRFADPDMSLWEIIAAMPDGDYALIRPSGGIACEFTRLGGANYARVSSAYGERWDGAAIDSYEPRDRP